MLKNYINNSEKLDFDEKRYEKNMYVTYIDLIIF